jgi:heat shock protein HslJ
MVAGATLAACSGGDSALLMGTWELVSYGDPANPIPAAADTDADTSVIFGEDGRISGNAGCNDFGRDHKVDGDKITFGTISSTLMMCADPAIGDQETTVLNKLTEMVTFAVDGDTLTLTSANGGSVIVLARK